MPIGTADRNKQISVNATSLKARKSGASFAVPLSVCGAIKSFNYFHFLASFFSLAGFPFSFFRGIQPQPQTSLFSAILITSLIIKCLSKHLNKCVIKFTYFFKASNSFNLCCTLIHTLSLLTSPACFNIFRCCETAATVMPMLAAMSLAPRGAMRFKHLDYYYTRFHAQNFEYLRWF